LPKSYNPTPPSINVQRILAGGRAYVMLLGDDGGSLAAEVDDNPIDISLLFVGDVFWKGSTTISA